MIHVEYIANGVLGVWDANTKELLHRVQVEDFLMWLDLMSLEQKGLIEICARINPELGPTIPMTLPNIT